MTMHVQEVMSVDNTTFKYIQRSTALATKHVLARRLTDVTLGEAQEELMEHSRVFSLYRPMMGYVLNWDSVAYYMIQRNRDDVCHDFLRQVSISFCRIPNKAYRGPRWDAGRDPLDDNQLFCHPEVKTSGLSLVDTIQVTDRTSAIASSP
ncbi:hypothetical protein N8T08_003838 [Aspergillus melleus]|uniref:Uncharacterized protein n=1 Tax=Aspergillus melleus TaxID=138277 RepID=A0ACC3B696_9EURO|nr:hypothetical protein N8T08_003838 [Aspergillus melleus]